MWIRKYKYLVLLLFFFAGMLAFSSVEAQCSICTRTAQQLGEKPARGLNAGILYLAFTPLAIIGVVAFRVLKKQKSQPE